MVKGALACKKLATIQIKTKILVLTKNIVGWILATIQTEGVVPKLVITMVLQNTVLYQCIVERMLPWHIALLFCKKNSHLLKDFWGGGHKTWWENWQRRVAQSSSEASLFTEEHDTPVPQVRYSDLFVDCELHITFHAHISQVDRNLWMNNSINYIWIILLTESWSLKWHFGILESGGMRCIGGMRIISWLPCSLRLNISIGYAVISLIYNY